MKPFFIFVIFILSISLCLSASIEMEDNFYLGDNVVVKVSANFYDQISPDEIDFYRRHMLTSFENVKTIKVENEQYISFKVPLEKIPDNYSINLTVKEKFFGTYQTNDISKSFLISNETGRFYIENNFIIASEDYQIYVENMEDEEIIVKINPELNDEVEKSFFESLFSKSSSSGESISLKPYEGKFVDFEIGNETRLVKVSFQSGEDLQNILVYEQVSLHENFEKDNVSSEEDNEEVVDEVAEENESEDDSEEMLEEEAEESSKEKNEEINESENLPETEKEGTNEGSILESCEEMEGKKCNRNNETCEGVVEEARDGVCCIGECVEKEIDNSGKWVGWTLLIIVLGSVGYAFLKSKQKKGESLKLPKK